MGQFEITQRRTVRFLGTAKKADGSRQPLNEGSGWIVFMTVKRSKNDSDAAALVKVKTGSGLTHTDAAQGEWKAEWDITKFAGLPDGALVHYEITYKDPNGGFWPPTEENGNRGTIELPEAVLRAEW